MIICVAGMHRSGTSLMASYLARNGIMMGEKLLGPGKGNEMGHFEDHEFLDLHKQILEENKCNTLVPKRNIVISKDNQMVAEKLISSKSQITGNWGWKEPRSTLFLDFWANLLPDAKFLLMYRDPYQVIGSIYRRMRLRYLYGAPWLAPLSWLRYNEDVIKFYDANRERACIVSINGFNSNAAISSEKLADALGIELTTPYTEVYKPKQMRDEKRISGIGFPGNAWFSLAHHLFSTRIDDLYKKLNERALISSISD